MAAAVPEQKIQKRSLGEPPVSEQEIAALERRLSRGVIAIVPLLSGVIEWLPATEPFYPKTLRRR